MSPKLNPNCYGFATRYQKLYFCFVGCRKPKKVGNHWDIHIKAQAKKSREQANEIGIQVQRRQKMTTLEDSAEVCISNACNTNATI